MVKTAQTARIGYYVYCKTKTPMGITLLYKYYKILCKIIFNLTMFLHRGNRCGLVSCKWSGKQTQKDPGLTPQPKGSILIY
jgi:hypothetical protein